jgi:lysine-N-methylase
MSTLHIVKNLQVLAPKFLTQFRCVGPSCPDSCCSGWTVAVDRKTHQAYLKSKDSYLTDRFSSKLQRTRSIQSEHQYSKIEMDQTTGACPFLEEHLCGIQKRLGEDKLSNTCFSYPRQTRSIGGVRQQSLSLSCPEAARLALTQSDAMEFDSVPSPVRINQVSVQPRYANIPQETLNSLRFSCIQILQYRALPLWERLACLAPACELIEKSMLPHQVENLEASVSEFVQAVKVGQASEALEALRPDHDAQAVLFAKMWGLKMNQGRSAAHQRVQSDVVTGLGIDPHSGTVNSSEVVRRYLAGLNLMTASMRESPHALENFVINEMFVEVFPFGMERPLLHYRKLVIKFGMVRLMLAARCNALGRPLISTEIIETVQVFSRLYEHWRDFDFEIDKILSNAQWDSVENIFRFLRSDE